MPPLYGEGEKAFRRLQLEIIRSTRDLSVFAWSRVPKLELERDPTTQDSLLCGVLATNPAHFEGCNDYLISEQDGYREYSVTNVGIKIRAQLLGRPMSDKGPMRYGYVLPLNCTTNGRELGLRLRQVGYNEYVRANPFTLFQYDKGRLITTRSAERHLLLTISNSITCHERTIVPRKRTHVLQISALPPAWPMNLWPADRYDTEDQLFFVGRDTTQDFAMVNIAFLIQSPKIPSRDYKWVRCKLIAVGWSCTEPHIAQFGIIDKEQYAAEIRAVRPEITEWDMDSKLLAHALNQHKIPKTAAVRFPLPRTAYVAHVTFSSQVQVKPEISLNKLWNIGFSCAVWPLDSQPDLVEEKWDSGGVL
ncbi:hypothetical protein ACEQ8H_008693 [Pleosporales sp. CAS-2024a]